MTHTESQFDFRLPGYELLREIGRGGVSTVYLARHELLGRNVAIKVMSPVLAVEQGFNKRFIREGKTVGQLDHPGIVSVYDVAVVDHRPFIAMEYLPGGSLKDRIKAGMEPREAVDLLRTIAESLGYAHSRGVFHRDVKPENILFRDNGEAVLTDFGIAKSDSQDTALTSIGVVVGTPRYISPEQAQGEGGDARSDIYALGVILHEMLTGKPPYDVQGSMSLLYAHINEPIPRLPDRFSAYQPLLDDLLAKDPEQRIADCASLLNRLEAPDRSPRRRMFWSRRGHRRAAGASGWRARRKTVAAAAAVPVLLAGAWLFGYLSGNDGGAQPRGELKEMVSGLLAPGGATDPGSSAPAPAPQAGQPEPNGSTPMIARSDTTWDRLLTAGPDTAPLADNGDRTGEGVEEISALEEFEIGANLDAESIYNQAQALLSGEVKEENLKAAARLHEQAAIKGHALSQYYLGVAYGNGDGVEPDEALALQWLERAAKADVRGARYNLVLAGIFGPNRDTAAAARQALELAKDKYAPAYRILGWMYNTGTGVESSFTQSVRWNARTMMGQVTGKADAPRWVVRRWERRLRMELGKIRDEAPSAEQPVVR
ncbi:MAG TPA: serine/threonine-protein kinase [Arenicellales bacterium]|nr:serine/threonine-protein kinase [Arenicellales bacterium]